VAATLTDLAGESELPLDAASLERLHGREDFFWLDLDQPAGSEIDLVGTAFGFHPIAIEDVHQFGRRPRLDGYDGYAYLILYGSAPDADDLVEVHAFYSERFLITIRRDECPGFAAARARLSHGHFELEHPIALLYRVVDGLVDSFFPVLSEIDDHIDALTDQIVARPTDLQLQSIFQTKRRLVALRRVIAPMRDLFASVAGGAVELPGLTEKAERYFRDVYDHLIRLTDSVDSYRDLTSGTMDVYLSTVSNRLNGVMKQLAVIATIFLPLTFITGFFGQNFGWMVDQIGGVAAFVGLGLGLELLALGLLLGFFRKRGWF
jgi:magnesium transporter